MCTGFSPLSWSPYAIWADEFFTKKFREYYSDSFAYVRACDECTEEKKAGKDYPRRSKHRDIRS